MLVSELIEKLSFEDPNSEIEVFDLADAPGTVYITLDEGG